jgi:hypothetical protein
MKYVLLFVVFFYPLLSWKAPEMTIAENPITGRTPVETRSATFGSVVYDSLNLEQYGLSRRVFDMAYKGWRRLKSTGRVVREDVLSIVDFSQPSSKKRLYIIDLANPKLLFNTYVAHGRRSGKEVATKFSNRPRSLESSVGFYVTADTYMGTNGYSLKLNGMEAGFNSNAFRREIVLHGADYVSEQYITSNGCLGRSWGCPAVPLEESKDIIDSIKNGSCLFIYSPQTKYLKQSRILNAKA